MPRIASLRLSSMGRRRRAVLTVTGQVLFDGPGDDSLNGAYLRIILAAADRAIDDLDDIGETLSICDAWFVRGREERYRPVTRWDGRASGSENWQGGQVTLFSSNQSRFEFSWDNRREAGSRRLDRSFNEDRPGRDEVVATAQCLPSYPDGSEYPAGASDRVISNTISGRF